MKSNVVRFERPGHRPAPTPQPPYKDGIDQVTQIDIRFIVDDVPDSTPDDLPVTENSGTRWTVWSFLAGFILGWIL